MKPKSAHVLLEFEVDMSGWDNDVDWTDPEEVFREEYDSAGLYALTGDSCPDTGRFVGATFKPGKKK